jgi:multifunctional beta-oxidation protein
MSEQDWDLVTLVHLKGAYSCTKACWPLFRQQKVSTIIPYETSRVGLTLPVRARCEHRVGGGIVRQYGPGQLFRCEEYIFA